MPTVNDIAVEQTQFESSTRRVIQTFGRNLLIYALSGNELLVSILPDTRSCIMVQSLTKVVEAVHSKHVIRTQGVYKFVEKASILVMWC